MCIGILRHCCPRPSGVIIDTQGSHNISLTSFSSSLCSTCLCTLSTRTTRCMEATGLPELLARCCLLCLNLLPRLANQCTLTTGLPLSGVRAIISTYATKTCSLSTPRCRTRPFCNSPITCFCRLLNGENQTIYIVCNNLFPPCMVCTCLNFSAYNYC